MVVCVGGGGVYEQVNKGINYQACNTTQRCIYKLINQNLQQKTTLYWYVSEYIYLIV